MVKFLKIFLCIILISQFAKAQTPFEGEIVFEITYSGETETGEIAERMTNFLPTGYLYKMKGTNMLFKMEGGMMAFMLGEVLILGGEGKGYLLKPDEKLAYEFKSEQSGEVVKPTVTATGETEDIFGYPCKIYKVESVDGATGKKMEMRCWVTESISIGLGSAAQNGRAGNLMIDGVNGFILKTTANMMGMTMTNEVKRIEAKPLSASLFEVPYNFEIKDASKSGIPGF